MHTVATGVWCQEMMGAENMNKHRREMETYRRMKEYIKR
jgi:hypothetical protein